ncbi:MAG: FtsX-like permease family protein [Propionivibrio sp.]
MINNGRTDWSIIGEGIEAGKEAALGSQLRITSGHQLSETDTNGILLGQGVAQALKLHPGDQVTLLVNIGEGALNNLDFEVKGIFQSFSADFDARAVRIPLNAAKDLLASTRINTLVLSLHNTEDTQGVAGLLRSMLDPSIFEVNTWTDLNSFYASTVELYERQFGVLRLITLVLVLLSVANSVNMSVFERLSEFGTMMALGNHKSYVFRLLLVENTLLGLMGGTLGALLGIALAHIISIVGIPMPPPPNANIGYIAHILIIPSIVFDAFLTGALATMLAAIIPAWRVSRTPVDEALRHSI